MPLSDDKTLWTVENSDAIGSRGWQELLAYIDTTDPSYWAQRPGSALWAPQLLFGGFSELPAQPDLPDWEV